MPTYRVIRFGPLTWDSNDGVGNGSQLMHASVIQKDVASETQGTNQIGSRLAKTKRQSDCNKFVL